MACHETKNCPRCGAGFQCKPGNITQCQCFGITFTEAEKEHIRDSYNDCLCRNCLVQMKYESRYSAIKRKLQSILSIFK